MIFDALINHPIYRPLSARFARGFEWLTQFSPDMPDGRYAILDNDDLFALVQSYQTVSANMKQYESHRQYADVQYLCTGLETIHYAPAHHLVPATDYQPEKDCTLYNEPAGGVSLSLEPGAFAIFFPSDGHKPGCIDGSPGFVKKVVLKVRL